MQNFVSKSQLKVWENLRTKKDNEDWRAILLILLLLDDFFCKFWSKNATGLRLKYIVRIRSLFIHSRLNLCFDQTTKRNFFHPTLRMPPTPRNPSIGRLCGKLRCGDYKKWLSTCVRTYNLVGTEPSGPTELKYNRLRNKL